MNDVKDDLSAADRLDSQTLIKATFVFLAVTAIYFLSRSPGLDEWDSVQFAMGVREFNLWKHQPHPPGYPLFIFFGWIGTKLFDVGPEISLHFVSSLGGALFIAAWFLIIRLQFTERLAWWIVACLTITPAVWMTATKVLSDTLAAGFLSAEIFAAVWFCKSRHPAALLTASLFGAAATGARPQLILVVMVILVTAFWQTQSSWKMSILGTGTLVAGCLVWLLPTWYLQSRLRSDIPAWLVYPKLLYGQWHWRLDNPDTYLGAGDWSPRYLGTRLVDHILGWFGIGFGFVQSTAILAAGAAITIFGFVVYFLSRGAVRDQRFWKFHAPWAVLHIAIIFVCLGGKPRYYLIIFPLLLVALTLGCLRLRAPWNWTALALPALLLCITIPLAIQNHREESPSIRLVHYLEQLYPSPSQRKNVVLLFINARRHAEWYAPEFKTFRDVPSPDDLPQIVDGATAVYTDDARVALPAGWRRVSLATFQRSIIIHTKHHFLSLFLIEHHS
jgi:4-amino-4-deoxy-L-arabinose transferase-like glycosyltransferase